MPSSKPPPASPPPLPTTTQNMKFCFIVKLLSASFIKHLNSKKPIYEQMNSVVNLNGSKSNLKTCKSN